MTGQTDHEKAVEAAREVFLDNDFIIPAGVISIAVCIYLKARNVDPVSVKALEDAYKAGFEASAQGYNAEFFTEFESDNEWIAERDSAVDRIRTALSATPEGGE